MVKTGICDNCGESFKYSGFENRVCPDCGRRALDSDNLDTGDDVKPNEAERADTRYEGPEYESESLDDYC